MGRSLERLLKMSASLIDSCFTNCVPSLTDEEGFFTLIAVGHLRVLSLSPRRFVDSVCRDGERDVGALSVWCLVLSPSLALHHSHEVPFIEWSHSHVLLFLLFLACISFFARAFLLQLKKNKNKIQGFETWDLIRAFFFMHSLHGFIFEASSLHSLFCLPIFRAFCLSQTRCVPFPAHVGILISWWITNKW